MQITPATSRAQARVAVGIATVGRPETLAETLRELSKQTRCADRVIVAYVSEDDVSQTQLWPQVEFVIARPGLPNQRNAVLDMVADCDFVIFFDDDFFPSRGYIEATLDAFARGSDIVVTTGLVLADGIKGPGLSPSAARGILAANSPTGTMAIEPAFNGYGCNMGFRLAPIRQHGVRFDERLPLYAWYEDIDFSRRLSAYGKVVSLSAATGVHLGTKRGRTSGRRLGYSQVVNPIYLWRKGTYPLSHAIRSIGRNCMANLARAIRPEPWVDRRGRLTGNTIGFLDILSGRAKPERILDL